MAKILDTIISVDKGRKQFNKNTGGLSNEGDGIIGISVSVPKVPGTSIYGEIDTKDISASRAGIKGGEGGDESISIGKSGLSIESATSLGIGGNTSVSINVGGNGDVSASANTGISTPFGDFNITVDIVKEGCTITASKSFTSPFKTFTTTETYTAPGCKPKDPSPSPSPSGPNGEEPDFPQGRCIHHLIYMGIVSTTWIYYPDNHFYNGFTASFSQVLSVPATFRAGVAPGVTFSGEGNSFMISSSNSTWSVSEGWWPSSKSFGKTLSEVMPGPNVPFVYEISYAYIFFKNNTALPAHSGYPFGYSYMYSPYDKARVSPTSPPRPCSFAAYFNTECQGTYFPPTFSPSPKWNPPPMPEDKCCKETASMLRKLLKFFQVEEIEKKGFRVPRRLQITGGSGDDRLKNWAEITAAMIKIQDHLGLHPMSVQIADARPDIQGDQSVGFKAASATQALTLSQTKIWQSDGKIDSVQTFLYKLSILCTNLMILSAKQSGDLQAIKDALGANFIEATDEVTTPFNIYAGVKEHKSGQGFAQKDTQDNTVEIDPTKMNPPVLFPEFLKCRKNEFGYQQFEGGKDIMDMLTLILLHLEKNNTRSGN